MEIYGVKCLTCGAIVYSRANHDFHYCPCKKIGIDGGLEYTKISYDGPYKTTTVILADGITPEILYQDWNKRLDNYGTILTKDKK